MSKTKTTPASAANERNRGQRPDLTDSSGGSLLAEPRRRKILEWIEEEGSARVRDLSNAFNVSEATVRQDLDRLEADGHITREHGGAFLRSVPQQVQSMTLHHVENMQSKRSIGLLAAGLVGNNETIIVDSGTTTTEFAQNLVPREGLNVITSALNIALMLGANPTNTVLMPGGQFKAPTLSLSGEKASAFFDGIYAQKLFLATAGISFEAGLTYPAIGDLYVKRAMIKAASKVYLLGDSTKIGRTSLTSLGPITMIGTLITDSGISNSDRLRFEAAGIEVLIA